MKILVVGGGGREHAIVWKLSQSRKLPEIYCAPGNPGIAQLATCVPIDAEDVEQLAAYAESEAFDLVVVGPEAPLSAGLVDLLSERGITVFGPRQAAAHVEASKAFAKELMVEAGIPTARYAQFTDSLAAKDYVRMRGAPIVVKADGLAAGKGVVVAQTTEEAMEAIESMMNDRVFGASGSSVVIEEFMQGEEATVLAFVDGRTVKLMEPSQDHKPIFDGDRGPNTGGMGTYSPVPKVNAAMLSDVEQRIVRPLLAALHRRGIIYQGVLYTGLMLTDEGPKVVEFNARFGDPETQVVLPRLKTDLIDVALAVCNGTLDQLTLEWSDDAAVCVVMASEGYPGSYEKGRLIDGLSDVLDVSGDAIIFHAGTAYDSEGRIVTSGGRVLGVTGRGRTLQDAVTCAYRAAHAIHFDGAQFRNDIAAKALS